VVAVSDVITIEGDLFGVFRDLPRMGRVIDVPTNYFANARKEFVFLAQEGKKKAHKRLLKKRADIELQNRLLSRIRLGNPTYKVH